ncbi:flagellar basal body P-ring formation protein FlgA [Aliihoeflea aestuarii]|jgi:flagellar basal body P-ring formation protein FlgA|uniref:flagellar basal body P-ring formation chaperone FlgA n=1 Tax=Aliihoeflea aestuarii TaxID=453840 RepID=UPI002094514A|nr:flagellar basal body P-ring formation chaperone FlgA [Aliihoeflea aestuarii]MCO6392886.1 flagellar basal body P-ring formation protein FlgA [Aliihoeflea aestuarii]
MPRRVTGIAIATLALLAPALAAAQETVVVPTRVIYPGQEVGADALEIVPLRRNLPNPSVYALDLEQVAGKVARNTLLPGRMVFNAALRDAYVVEAGKPVEMRFVQGPLTISATGVPLQPGSAGDVVRIRNLDSGQIVSGVVMADGTVRISAS